MKDYIIKPNGWMMNGKEEFHGITLERANKEAVDIIDVLKEYKNDIEQYCSKLVSHNLDFDKHVIKSEFIRHDMIINDIGEYCTMKNTIDYCKITPKVRGEYKWPKLEQLYNKCFNEELQNAHNSYYDVENCAKCYFNLKNMNTNSHKPSTNVITIDDEIKDYVLKLLSTYSTKQLNRVMTEHNSKHVLAYAEEKLKRTNTTFRDLTVSDVFPIIMEFNNMVDHAPSDDDSSTSL